MKTLSVMFNVKGFAMQDRRPAEQKQMISFHMLLIWIKDRSCRKREVAEHSGKPIVQLVCLPFWPAGSSCYPRLCLWLRQGQAPCFLGRGSFKGQHCLKKIVPLSGHSWANDKWERQRTRGGGGGRENRHRQTMKDKKGEMRGRYHKMWYLSFKDERFWLWNPYPIINMVCEKA